jgi:transposase
MKTDFETKPFFLQDDIRIKAHFLICFLALVIYRYLERDLENAISYETILDKLRTMKRPGIKYYIPKQHNRRTSVKSRGTAIFLFSNCQRQDYNLCFFDGQDVFCELFVSSSISIILLQV